MSTQHIVGRISSIPIAIDISFAILAVLWGLHYFTSGSLNVVLMGLWVVAGGAVSILIHELAHAFAGRYFGVGTRLVELNGLGGLCHYDRVAPSRYASIVMSLAGPASNLVLWGLFEALAWSLSNSETFAEYEAAGWFESIASVLASLNFLLFWFNLMPSHPLDGGRALASLLSGPLGYDRAMTLVAWMGMAFAVWLGIAAFKYGMFTAIVAGYLFMHNQEVLAVHGGGSWKRRD